MRDSELGVERSKAMLNSSQARVRQGQANLAREADQLRKTTRFSPIDGVVSSLPVKVGQYALSGFSTTPLLTVADMSQINAEIKVDETDIADVKLGDRAKIKVDALGEIEIEGEVIEKGASAITRSGQTISQSSGSQEAKDFLVKVKLNPTPEVRDKLRPGMSTTATITTAVRENVLTVPLQAIVPREVKGEQTKEGEQPQQQPPAARRAKARGGGRLPARKRAREVHPDPDGHQRRSGHRSDKRRHERRGDHNRPVQDLAHAQGRRPGETRGEAGRRPRRACGG